MLETGGKHRGEKVPWKILQIRSFISLNCITAIDELIDDGELVSGKTHVYRNCFTSPYFCARSYSHPSICAYLWESQIKAPYQKILLIKNEIIFLFISQSNILNHVNVQLIQSGWMRNEVPLNAFSPYIRAYYSSMRTDHIRPGRFKISIFSDRKRSIGSTHGRFEYQCLE